MRASNGPGLDGGWVRHLNHHVAAVETPPEPVGRLLRRWCERRCLSQLDLALQARISTRHLSFVETGRSAPSRDMLLHLLEQLQLPLRDRNHLLLAAGFAPDYARRALDSLDMAPVRQALQRLLDHHQPFPALVMDRQWNILMTNPAAEIFAALLGEPESVWQLICGDGPRNLLKLVLHPHGLRGLIANLDEIAPALLAHLQREALESRESAQLLAEILAYTGIPSRWKAAELGAPPPVLATHIRTADMELRLFGMLSTFGTPQDLTTDELRVETLYPADAASETLLRRQAKVWHEHHE